MEHQTVKARLTQNGTTIQEEKMEQVCIPDKVGFSSSVKIVEPAEKSIQMIASDIYDVWTEYGPDGLYKYFVEILKVNSNQAKSFSRKYNPDHDPEILTKEEADKSNLPGTEIFEKLCLRLPSRNEENGIWPRNQLAWWVMKYIFGSENFSFDILGKTGMIRDNQIYFSRSFCTSAGDGLNFGLASLDPSFVDKLPQHIKRKASHLERELGSDWGGDLALMLIKAGFIYPPKKELDLLISALKRAREGEELLITGIQCPDYTYEETGDSKVPFRYTFETLNDGVGVVAKQFVRVMPLVQQFLEAKGIKYRFVFYVADFEANSEENLQRVGLSEAEFHDRCRRSMVAFQNELPDIPMELKLFQVDFAGDLYRQYKAQAADLMYKGNFGAIRQNTGKDANHEIKFIAEDGRSFYNNWHGRKLTDSEVERIVIDQAAEYASCGRVFAEKFAGQNVLQIAGDRPKMQCFGAMYCNQPILCTKRVY